MPEAGNAATATASIPDDASIPESIDAAPTAVETPGNPGAAGGLSASSGPIDDDAALDATLAAVLGGKSRKEATATYAAGSGKPAAVAKPATPSTPSADSAAAPGTTPAAAAAVQPDTAALAAEHRELLSRFKIRDSSFVKLDASERAELLANLKERHDAQARMYQDNVQLTAALNARQSPTQPQRTAAQGQPQQQQGNRPAAAAGAPATPADPYATIDGLLAPFLDKGQSLAEPIKAALAPLLERTRAAEERAEQAEAATTAFWQHVEEEHQAEGLKAVKPIAEGVNLDQRTTEGKANHEKLMLQAGRLVRAAMQEEGWNPYKYGWREAISDAFPSTFKAQTILAQRKAATQTARQTALRGGDPGGLPNRSTPKDSEDAVLDRVLKAQGEGATREEMTAIAVGRS